jgi:hypothetical protein
MKITQLPVTSKAMQTQQDTDCCPPCVPDIYLLEPFAASPAEAKAGLN